MILTAVLPTETPGWERITEVRFWLAPSSVRLDMSLQFPEEQARIFPVLNGDKRVAMRISEQSGIPSGRWQAFCQFASILGEPIGGIVQLAEWKDFELDWRKKPLNLFIPT